MSGYTDQASVVAGETFRLMVRSTLGKVTVTAYRMGWYAGAGARRVWASDPLAAPTQPPPTVETVGGAKVVSGRWAPLLTVPAADWPAGSYLLVLQAGGKGRYVPMTIRAGSVAGALVIVNPTATWEAYNTWGAGSLYEGKGGQPPPNVVSLDRPNSDNASHFLLDALPYVLRAGKAGLPVGYVTSADLENGALNGPLGVVSVGHDEYWSVPMRRAVEAARDAGSNLAFLGGNAMFWRIRFERNGRLVVGYRDRSAQDPVRGATTTAKWREAPVPVPENSLLGGALRVLPRVGSVHGLHPGLLPVCRHCGQPRHLLPGVGRGGGVRPRLSHCRDAEFAASRRAFGDLVRSRRPRLDAVYYSADSGAGVFSVGTIQWTKAVGAVRSMRPGLPSLGR
ncbi:MAG: hypothetical protein IPM08_03215 [Actinomycetales bacterium]|nr:hypothetical protein [Actinomycetales bacterium]